MSRRPIPTPLSERLGYLLGRAHLAHRRLAEERLSALGVGPWEFGALTVIAEGEPVSQRELGERMGIDRTTIVGVVDGLERAELVERRRNPADRRAYLLGATLAGLTILRKASRAADEAEAEFLARIPAVERRRLTRLLAQLIAPES